MDEIFIDSNVWLYQLLDGPKIDPKDYQYKRLIAIDLTQPGECIIVISTQVITETCAVLKRKTKITNEDILELVKEFQEQCEIINLTTIEIKMACQLRQNYYFSYWDSLMIATALKSQARVLYSEDMQHGLLIDNRLTVSNPFFRTG